MSKTKQAIKEVNRMADLELLKSKVRGYASNAVKWLDVEFYGHKRGKLLFVAAIVIMVVAQTV